MPTLFAQALKQICKQEPEFLAVTGDLLDVPTWVMSPPPGFILDDRDVWLEAARTDYHLLKQLLDDTGLPYMVLPGNHDLADVMWTVFDPNEHTQDVADFRVLRFEDFEHDCHFPRRFNPQRTRWEQAIADPDSPPQIHLQHYVITPALNADYPHTYREGEHLAARNIASGRVHLCLSGHYHHGTPLLKYGKTTFTTGPAFCQYPFPWRVYDINKVGVEMTEHQLGPGAATQRKVVFLDRDGVINDQASYSTGTEAMNLLPHAAQAIRKLNDAGRAVVVVSNQSCIGSGYVPDVIVQAVNDKMCRLLAEQGAQLDGIYYSSHAGSNAVLPQYVGNGNAKPKPDLLLKAAVELNLDLQDAWMVGDRAGDVQTAINAGAQPILVRTGLGIQNKPTIRLHHPDVPVVDDLSAAIQHVLGSV